MGDLGSIAGLGRSPGERKGYPLQYPDLENSVDHIVHGVTKSWIRLNDFHFHTIVDEKSQTPNFILLDKYHDMLLCYIFLVSINKHIRYFFYK